MKKDVTTIAFRAKAKGFGIIQKDGTDVQKSLLYGKDGFGIINKNDNVGGFSKKEFSKDSFKIKINRYCINKSMSKMNGDDILQPSGTMYASVPTLCALAMANPFNLMRGWMITKDNSSAFTRNSSCTMDSFVQSNDAVPSLETCITDDVVKQSLISYRLQESVGDVEYTMKYGSINLDNLQFVNLTEEDLASQIPSDILEEALSYINGSSYNYKLKYYKKESSTFKDILSNKGFVLTDEHILTIVRDYFERLFQLVIDKSSAHFEITELEYKLITNPFDEKNEDGWVKINSLEDIDNIEFEPRRFYTEISDEEMEQYRIYNTSLDVCRAEIKAKQKQKQADKAAENKERRERRKREKELEEEAKTE